MFGQIWMQDTNINANCYTNINNVLFPFFSASNTFTQSDVLKCNVKPNIIISLGIALTYTLTMASILKTIDRFYILYKENKDTQDTKDNKDMKDIELIKVNNIM